MSFSIETFTSVLLKSVNIRAEMFGPDPVPAVDIGFRLVGSNNLLAMFDAGLKPALYKGTGTPSDQPELDGVDPVSEMPELRSSSIEMPISLSREYLGRNMVVDYGLGGKSNIELSAVDINNFRLNCKEGGTVEIDFRAQASGLDGPTLGKLGALVKHDVKITLVSSPESDNTQEAIPGGTTPFKFTAPEGGIVDNNPPAPAAKSAKAPLTAADVFIEQHAPKAAAKKVPVTVKKSRAASVKKPAAKKAGKK